MTRLPLIPQDWLADNPADAGESSASLDGARDFDVAARSSPTPAGVTGLSMLMDPSQIATVPGLPTHYYADQPASDHNQVAAVQPVGQSNPRPSPGPRNPIGPVQGYPETGKDAWRAGNDDAIIAAAKKYNSDNKYFPGDAEYMSPQLMKAWQMRESGGSRQAFESDPFQVNKSGDWADEKATYAGLSKGQAMTPQTSADAALKWLQRKGTVHGKDGSAVSYLGAYKALRNYNAKKDLLDGVPKDVGYANDVLNRAWASYGDWQK